MNYWRQKFGKCIDKFVSFKHEMKSVSFKLIDAVDLINIIRNHFTKIEDCFLLI